MEMEQGHRPRRAGIGTGSTWSGRAEESVGGLGWRSSWDRRACSGGCSLVPFPPMLGRDSRFLRWWMRWRLGMLWCVDGAVLFCRQTHAPEDGPQREVVSRFEHSCQDERQSEDEQGTLEQQAGEDRAGCRSDATRQRGHAGGGSALLRVY